MEIFNKTENLMPQRETINTLKNLTSLEIYMIFVSLFGNTFLYFQVVQFIKQRNELSWNQNGSHSRLISYLVSLWSCISWIIYSICISDALLFLSGIIALIGTILCLSIIIIYSIINRIDPIFKEPIYLSLVNRVNDRKKNISDISYGSI